ncbi:MAG: hypothetical protein OEX00_12535, partial [Gammaproteobacteria bacterium]|nr:hypothetical protein [Gammaproteobacteria bacterium]
MNKKIVQLISLTFLQAMFASSSLAKEVYDWSITTYAGMHHPNIETLSEGLYNSPMVGKAPALEDVDGSAALVEFRIDAPLVEVGNAAKAGAEFQWKPGKRHSFIFGASGLEKTSITRLDTKFPIQGVVRPTTLERRGKLSYTEYYLGWRYGLFESKKLRMYSRLVVHEIFDVDYREDFSFLFPYWDVGD